MKSWKQLRPNGEFAFGLKEVCNRLLEKYGMVHAFFHAPLDDAEFGTSASLVMALFSKPEYIEVVLSLLAWGLNDSSVIEGKGEFMKCKRNDLTVIRWQ